MRLAHAHALLARSRWAGADLRAFVAEELCALSAVSGAKSLGQIREGLAGLRQPCG